MAAKRTSSSLTWMSKAEVDSCHAATKSWKLEEGFGEEHVDGKQRRIGIHYNAFTMTLQAQVLKLQRRRKNSGGGGAACQPEQSHLERLNTMELCIFFDLS